MPAIFAYTIGLVIRLAGALRYKSGRRLLTAYLQLNKDLPAPELFAAGWRFIQQFNWLYRGREISGNRYRIPWQNLAFLGLLRRTNRIAKLVPDHRVEDDSILLLSVEEQAPTVVVTIHSGIEFVLNRFFEERGIAYSVISVTRAVQGLSETLGLRGFVDIIPQSADGLLMARKKLKEGKLVCTCVDFSLRQPGTFYHDLFIATELFEFAKNCRARLVYAVSTVSDGACIITKLSSPKAKETDATATVLAEDFIAFLHAVLQEPEDWKVGPWTLRTASSQKQFDNFCVRRPGTRRNALLAP